MQYCQVANAITLLLCFAVYTINRVLYLYPYTVGTDYSSLSSSSCTGGGGGVLIGCLP